ncbi:MAG: hypothetical protein ACREUC_23960 [Steroidobacteraceae bacterium]
MNHDVGGGWLIFDAPAADLGVHPTQGEGDPPSDHGYGLVTYFKVPGNFSVQLYQPKYPK